MFNSIYDHTPATYHALRHCWLETRRFDYICQYLESLTDFEPNSRKHIVEIGCGTGRQLIGLARTYPHLEFIGIEPNPAYRDFAVNLIHNEGLTNSTVLCAKAEDFTLNPIQSSSAAVLLSNDVLHHVARWDLLFENLQKLTSQQTHWLAIEPNPLNIYSALRQTMGPGEKIFRKWNFCRLARTFGWQISSVKHLFLWPPWMKSPPSAKLRYIERALERIPFIGGGVAIHLVRRQVEKKPTSDLIMVTPSHVSKEIP